MTLELVEIENDPRKHNPYIQWGEDILSLLDSREFGSNSRDKEQFDRDLRHVLVRPKAPGISANDAIARCETLTRHLVSDVEKQLFERLPDPGPDIEFVAAVPALWPLGAADDALSDGEAAFLSEFAVVAAGPRVFNVDTRADQRGTKSNLGPAPTGQIGTVAGIIDDGIAYLNQRVFDRETPRIKSLLIQTASYSSAEGGAVLTSRVLDEQDIRNQQKRATEIGETAAYARLHRNDPLLSTGIPPGIQRTVEQAASHGSFMLDLMAGAAQDASAEAAELRAIPILAAQLPPQSVDDTSGARLELPILVAMRWMIVQALRMRAERLVLNLSFGVSAGTKDGHSFMELAFEKLVNLADLAGLEMHLVLPFGNEYLSRGVQVSGLKSKDSETAEPDSPDAEILMARANETPSFVEIHSTDAQALPDDLEIAVTMPDGTFSGFAPIKAGHDLGIMVNDALQGRIFHLPPQNHFGSGAQHGHLIVAFSPSAEPRRQPPKSDFLPQSPYVLDLVAAGRWKLHLRSASAAGLPIAVQVQRDDSAFGYHNRGPQTVLDSAAAYEYAIDFRDRSALCSTGPLTHTGTNTAYVSRNWRIEGDGGIHTIAAARDYVRKRDVTWQNGKGSALPAPSDYASMRADWSAQTPPTQAIIVDSEMALPGVTAAGTTSGSVTRQTGSSAAAALFSRSLIVGANLSQQKPVKSEDLDRIGQSAKSLPDTLRRSKRKQQVREISGAP